MVLKGRANEAIFATLYYSKPHASYCLILITASELGGVSSKIDGMPKSQIVKMFGQTETVCFKTR